MEISFSVAFEFIHVGHPCRARLISRESPNWHGVRWNGISRQTSLDAWEARKQPLPTVRTGGFKNETRRTFSDTISLHAVAVSRCHYRDLGSGYRCWPLRLADRPAKKWRIVHPTPDSNSRFSTNAAGKVNSLRISQGSTRHKVFQPTALLKQSPTAGAHVLRSLSPEFIAIFWRSPALRLTFSLSARDLHCRT